MISKYKTTLEGYLEPLAVRLHRVNPNILTLVGSIPSLLFFVCMLNQWIVAALIIYVGNVIDMLDGYIARKYRKVTAFGGFLDSFMDRIADFLIITAFSFSGLVRWEITAPLLLFAYLTSYARSRGELANPSVSFALGIIERPERLILIYVALILYVLIPSLRIFSFNTAEIIFILIAGFSLITVLQRVIHAYKKL